MKLFGASLAVCCAGYLVAISLLMRAASGQINTFILFVAAWYAVPGLICSILAWRFRCWTVPSSLALLTSVVAAGVGVGLPYKIMYVDPPDAQAGIALVFIPAFQVICLSPFLLATVVIACFTVPRKHDETRSSEWPQDGANQIPDV